MAVQNFLSPVNNATVANVVMWTMGFFAVLAGYRFVAVMRVQRSEQDTDAGQSLSLTTELTSST